MKTVLKTNLFVVCLVFLCCFGITALSHGQATVSVDPAESLSPGVGSQLTIGLKISNGRNVSAYQVSVNFDTSALRYVSGANGSYLPSGAFFAPPQVSGGKVTVTATSVSGAARGASGTLASVTFSVVAVKKSTLRLTDVILSDSNARALSVQIRNGTVVEGGAKWDPNGDGQVNVLDLVLVAKSLGTRNAHVDTNGDGTVNVLDLVVVAQHLGESTGGGVPPPVVTPPVVTPPVVTPPVVTPPVVTPPVTPAKPTIDPPPQGMVLIPAGEFLMGSNDAESQNDEQPVRKVYVDAFYMDETEVTNAQFKEFLIENPRWQKGRIDKRFADVNYMHHWSGNNYPSGKGNHPVVYVSWYAAMAYAEWSGKRLPTESEWEYAGRGGLSGKKYPNGNSITARDANYDNNVKDTTAVGRYPANGYGLYDMAGNVFEWCLDEYDKDFYFTFPRSGVARNPLSGANSIQWILDNYTEIKGSRVLRGGSWGNAARIVRVAFRNSNLPSYTYFMFGFRCVKDVTP